MHPSLIIRCEGAFHARRSADRFPSVCPTARRSRSEAHITSTIVRWIVAGCPGRTGERVRLRATRAGSRWLVAADDLDAFFEALGADPTNTPATTTPTRTAAQERRSHTAAKKKLVEDLGPTAN